MYIQHVNKIESIFWFKNNLDISNTKNKAIFKICIQNTTNKSISDKNKRNFLGIKYLEQLNNQLKYNSYSGSKTTYTIKVKKKHR